MSYLRRLLGLDAANLDARTGQSLESLESRAMLAADIAVSTTNVSNFFDKRSSADRVQLTVALTNVGDEAFRGRGNVEFYLSTDGTFDSGDALFATLKVPSLSAGQRKTLNLNVLEPKDVNPPNGRTALPAGNYAVIARVTGLDDNAANDVATASGAVAVNYEFGTGEGGVRVPLTIPLPDGTSITLRISGSGSGNVRNEDGRTIVTLLAGGSRSEFFITTNAKGTSTIQGLEIDDVFKRIVADKINVDGNIIINGGVGNLSVAGLSNGSLFYTATNFGFFLFQSTIFKLGNVRDAIVSTDVPINSFDVKSWIDTNGGGDLLSAPSAVSLSSGGDFQPSVSISSQSVRERLSLVNVNVKGRVSGSWRLAFGARKLQFGDVTPDYKATVGGAVDSLYVSGTYEGLFAATQINKVFVGRDMRGGTILAGAQLGSDVLLGGTGTGADTYRASTINDVQIRGSMINSLIAAGIRSTDTVFLNADDTFATGTSRIGKIQVYKDVDNSHFASPSLPARVRIKFQNNVMTSGNAAFVSTLPIMI
ncbi:MAG: hypothetical protein WC718_06755 [Phycisphaerales bacterium]|jgi:hypothetical protein